MEKKQGIWDIVSQIFVTYGATVLALNIFCITFGDDAKTYSEIFAMGSSGIDARTNLHFMLMSVIIVLLRFLFLTDAVIKKPDMTARTVMMFTSVFAVAVIFILIFGWFPVNMLSAWFMFLICFAAGGTVTTIVTAHREKQENELLNSALSRMKEEL